MDDHLDDQSHLTARIVIPDALSVAERVAGLVVPAMVYGYKSQPR
jgi:hypothetical protein